MRQISLQFSIIDNEIGKRQNQLTLHTDELISTYDQFNNNSYEIIQQTSRE